MKIEALKSAVPTSTATAARRPAAAYATSAHPELARREPGLHVAACGREDGDALIDAAHPARIVWRYVQQIDLSELQAALRDGLLAAGEPPPDPRAVLDLWLYACIEGIGNAHQIEHLTETDDGFRWLRHGVPIDHKFLSDFRWEAAVVADRLLIRGIACLWAEGLVSLASLSDDCVRLRAPSGISALRRMVTLDRLLLDAEERITRLRQEIDADPMLAGSRLRPVRSQYLRRA